jgi:putative peptidoglycan lipid II flippase
MMVKVLASGFYARQNIKTPVKVGAFAMVVNTILCALLITPLAHAGLTLASTIAGYVNFSILLYLLIRRDIYKPSSGWARFIMQLVVANLVMSSYLLWVVADISYWMSLPILHRLAMLLSHVFVAALIYLIGLAICGMRPSEFRSQMKERS